jgi:hypothetical protein
MKLIDSKKCRNAKIMLMLLLLAFNFSAKAQWNFSTDYFKEVKGLSPREFIKQYKTSA